MRKLVLITALAALGIAVTAAEAMPTSGLQSLAVPGATAADSTVHTVTWGHRHHYGYHHHHYGRPYYYSYHYRKPWYGYRHSYWRPYHHHYRRWHY